MKTSFHQKTAALILNSSYFSFSYFKINGGGNLLHLIITRYPPSSSPYFFPNLVIVKSSKQSHLSSLAIVLLNLKLQLRKHIWKTNQLLVAQCQKQLKIHSGSSKRTILQEMISGYFQNHNNMLLWFYAQSCAERKTYMVSVTLGLL